MTYVARTYDLWARTYDLCRYISWSSLRVKSWVSVLDTAYINNYVSIEVISC